MSLINPVTASIAPAIAKTFGPLGIGKPIAEGTQQIGKAFARGIEKAPLALTKPEGVGSILDIAT